MAPRAQIEKRPMVAPSPSAGIEAHAEARFAAENATKPKNLECIPIRPRRNAR
jgi:hypothetical protein